jgi:hypothetical protein
MHSRCGAGDGRGRIQLRDFRLYHRDLSGGWLLRVAMVAAFLRRREPTTACCVLHPARVVCAAGDGAN